MLTNLEVLALLAPSWVVWKLGKFANGVTDEMLKRRVGPTCDLLEKKLANVKEAYSKSRRKQSESIDIDVMIPGEDCELILLMPSGTKGKEDWFDPPAIQRVLDSYRPLLEDADSIVLSRQKGGKWRFEYMLTKDGCVIGTKRCYDRTMDLFHKIEAHNRAVRESTPELATKKRDRSDD